MSDKKEERCAGCGVEFEKGSGRYCFNEDYYCPTCWKDGQIQKRINESH